MSAVKTLERLNMLAYSNIKAIFAVDGKSSSVKGPARQQGKCSWSNFSLPGTSICDGSSEERGFASVICAALLQPGALGSLRLTPQAAAREALELGSLRHQLSSQSAA